MREWLRVQWAIWSGYFRHGPHCDECDRPRICLVLRKGGRPCDRSAHV